MKRLIITIHGIRTFGQWQERLEHLIVNDDQCPDDIEFAHWKYGYFSVFAFLFPPFRAFATRNFKKELIDLESNSDYQRIDIVAHSFGTHIIAKAIKSLPIKKRPRIDTLILAGSVLKHSFVWSSIIGKGVKRVLNDCGTKDNILILSQAAVLLTGMAGRIGFTGFMGKNLRNRYFEFGHSGYFEKKHKPYDDFMKHYWVPFLLTDATPESIDQRKPTLINGIITFLSKNSEPITLLLYLTPITFAYNYYINKQNEILTAKLLEQSSQAANKSITRSDSIYLAAKYLTIDFSPIMLGNLVKYLQAYPRFIKKHEIDYSDTLNPSISSTSKNGEFIAKLTEIDKSTSSLEIYRIDNSELIYGPISLEISRKTSMLQISNDGKHILVSSTFLDANYKLWVFNIKTKKTVFDIKNTDLLRISSSAMSSDGKYLAINSFTGNDQELITSIVKLNGNDDIKKLQGKGSNLISFFGNGKGIVFFDTLEKRIRTYDLTTNQTHISPISPEALGSIIDNPNISLKAFFVNQNGQIAGISWSESNENGERKSTLAVVNLADGKTLGRIDLNIMEFPKEFSIDSKYILTEEYLFYRPSPFFDLLNHVYTTGPVTPRVIDWRKERNVAALTHPAKSDIDSVAQFGTGRHRLLITAKTAISEWEYGSNLNFYSEDTIQDFSNNEFSHVNAHKSLPLVGIVDDIDDLYILSSIGYQYTENKIFSGTKAMKFANSNPFVAVSRFIEENSDNEESILNIINAETNAVIYSGKGKYSPAYDASESYNVNNLWGFSSNDRYLAFMNDDYEYVVLDIKTGNTDFIDVIDIRFIKRVWIDNNGRSLLLLDDDDGILHMFDVKTRSKSEFREPGLGQRATILEVSGNGEHIAYTKSDTNIISSVLLRELKNKNITNTMTFTGHITAISLDETGSYLAVAIADIPNKYKVNTRIMLPRVSDRIEIWDTLNKSLIISINAKSSDITLMNNGMIHIVEKGNNDKFPTNRLSITWKPEKIMAAACQSLPNNIGKQKWIDYVGDFKYKPLCENLPEGPIEYR